MTIGSQLALNFPHQSRYWDDDFLRTDANRDACAWLDRVAEWPDLRLLIWGEAGCGKTHLLHMWVRRMGAVLWRAPDLSGIPPEADSAGLAIDDADAPAEEAALLHVLNNCRERGIPVVLAARYPPSAQNIRLPDLASRLRATVAVPIGRPDDAFLRLLVVRLLDERDLRYTPSLPDWLLRRFQRSPDALRDAVARLDLAALAAHGPVTRAMASQVLGLEGDGGSEPMTE